MENVDITVLIYKVRKTVWKLRKKCRKEIVLIL